MAKRGLRVLAFAYRDGAELNGTPYTTHGHREAAWFFLGLVALSDPVRPEVPAAIHACHTAGIRVIMITGDYALTAASIGRANRPRPRPQRCEHSPARKFPRWMTTGCAPFLPKVKRSLPASRRSINCASSLCLKQMGEIVAVTGDGVNDAPALKKADIGIAMGLRGNDVAKEASRMILTDDNFSSIVAAIEEGRAIFDNIKRFAAYVLNSNPQEMYPYHFLGFVPRHAAGDDRDGRVGGRCGHGSDSGHGLGHRAAGRRDHGTAAAAARRKAFIASASSCAPTSCREHLLPLSCYATYYYMGWVLGAWRPGESLSFHAGVAARTQLHDSIRRLFANPDRLLFPDGHRHKSPMCFASARGVARSFRLTS